jgi:hypothetical protein
LHKRAIQGALVRFLGILPGEMGPQTHFGQRRDYNVIAGEGFWVQVLSKAGFRDQERVLWNGDEASLTDNVPRDPSKVDTVDYDGPGIINQTQEAENEGTLSTISGLATKVC